MDVIQSHVCKDDYYCGKIIICIAFVSLKSLTKDWKYGKSTIELYGNIIS